MMLSDKFGNFWIPLWYPKDFRPFEIIMTHIHVILAYYTRYITHFEDVNIPTPS